MSLAEKRTQSLAMLRRWHGKYAGMREMSPDRLSLTIGVTEFGKREWLQIACIGPEFIQGPIGWPESRIEIDVIFSLAGKELVAVSDVQAGLRVIAGNFEIAEMVRLPSGSVPTGGVLRDRDDLTAGER